MNTKDLRFTKDKLYVLLGSKLVLVLDASKDINYSINNVWDYSTIHLFSENDDFETFDHSKAPESRGHFLKESDLLEIFEIIKKQ